MRGQSPGCGVSNQISVLGAPMRGPLNVPAGEAAWSGTEHQLHRRVTDSNQRSRQGLLGSRRRLSRVPTYPLGKSSSDTPCGQPSTPVSSLPASYFAVTANRSRIQIKQHLCQLRSTHLKRGVNDCFRYSCDENDARFLVPLFLPKTYGCVCCQFLRVRCGSSFESARSPRQHAMLQVERHQAARRAQEKTERVAGDNSLHAHNVV